MSDYIDVDALCHVGLLGLAFGVGVVALYAVGIVGFSRGGDARATATQRLAGQALAALCLAICVAAVVFGIWTMLDK